jgi:hypothetical protein
MPTVLKAANQESCKHKQGGGGGHVATLFDNGVGYK